MSAYFLWFICKGKIIYKNSAKWKNYFLNCLNFITDFFFEKENLDLLFKNLYDLLKSGYNLNLCLGIYTLKIKLHIFCKIIIFISLSNGFVNISFISKTIFILILRFLSFSILSLNLLYYYNLLFFFQ